MAREIVAMRRSSNVKFVCSYGGRILPRKSDGVLRYVGGLTRVLSVDRSVCFSDLMVKLMEFCGFTATLRCQLPEGDLETLVSIKSDEELASLLEEYEQKASKKSSPPPSPLKIRAVLAPQSKELISPPPSTGSSSEVSPRHSPRNLHDLRSCFSPPGGSSSPVGFRNQAGKVHYYPCYGPGMMVPRVLCAAAPPPRRCNHWQLNSSNNHRIGQIDHIAG